MVEDVCCEGRRAGTAAGAHNHVLEGEREEEI
jgi:hypothetical protein